MSGPLLAGAQFASTDLLGQDPSSPAPDHYRISGPLLAEAQFSRAALLGRLVKAPKALAGQQRAHSDQVGR